LNGQSTRPRIEVGSAGVQALAGILVVDFTRYLPGAYASRELLRLGARVVRVESPEGDPMRETAPEWDAALRSGTESVTCDLKADPDLARMLSALARDQDAQPLHRIRRVMALERELGRGLGLEL
jgi:crotonobetainyl-CoA:carnitine CoA-transferase CaiB-like acyl-CoA transferase